MIWLFSALGIANRALSAFFGFLRTLSPSTLAIIALLILSGLQWHFGKGVARDRDRQAAGWGAEKTAHMQTIANYADASRLAEAKQAANLERTKHAYAQNVEIVLADKGALDADWRARFERLRGSKAAIRFRPSGRVSMPSLPATPGQSPRPDDNPLGLDTVAVRIDDLEKLVGEVNQGEAIRRLWIANEAVDTSPD